MDWVSFDEIKKTVTLEMALGRYGISLRRLNATTLRGRCPLPTHRSEKSSESFTATLNRGVGGAWACQSQSCIKARGRVGGNVLDFVAAMEQCSVRDAAIKLQTWFLVPAAGGSVPIAANSPHDTPKSSSEIIKHEPTAGDGNADSKIESSNKPLGFTLQNIEHTHPYLGERGVSTELAKQLGIGFFRGKGSMHDRIVIPIHNAKGELVAYAGRSIDGSEPRYKLPPGFHKSLELFNLHRATGELSVVLVEGFFDCVKVTQAGFACVALMGSTMSKVQAELLADHFAEVVVMLDGDEAGRNASVEILDRLQRIVYRVRAVSLEDGVQPDTLTPDEIRRLLTQG